MGGRGLSECTSDVKELFVPLGRERGDGDDACADGFGQPSGGASGVFFLYEHDFDTGGAGLVNELLQMFGRRFFAVSLHGQLVEAEVAGKVTQCRVIDDERALVLPVE